MLAVKTAFSVGLTLFSWMVQQKDPKGIFTREVSPTAVANGQLNETYVLVLYNQLWTPGGYCHTLVEKVNVGTWVVFGNGAGLVYVTSPAMGEWEDNVTSVAPGEDSRCGVTSVGGERSFA